MAPDCIFLKKTTSNYNRPLLKIDQEIFTVATMKRVDRFLAEFKKARNTAHTSLSNLARFHSIPFLQAKRKIAQKTLIQNGPVAKEQISLLSFNLLFLSLALALSCSHRDGLCHTK